MQALGFRLGRRHGNGDSQLEVRSRPTGGAMTSRSSTTAAGTRVRRWPGPLGVAAAYPPGARALGATAPPSLGAAVVARWSRVELPAVHEGG